MIIVGLGNPGKEYEQTRHNVGFMIIDQLRQRLAGRDWQTERDVAWSKVGSDWLIKPQKFMNRSGQALRDWLQYRHLPHQPADLSETFIVVHDELEFPEETM